MVIGGIVPVGVGIGVGVIMGVGVSVSVGFGDEVELGLPFNVKLVGLAFVPLYEILKPKLTLPPFAGIVEL
jgi:hypothetical protein